MAQRPIAVIRMVFRGLLLAMSAAIVGCHTATPGVLTATTAPIATKTTEPAIRPLELSEPTEAAGDLLNAGVKRVTYKSNVDGAEDWAMFTPPPAGSRTWAVYLHGHGATGDQLFARPDVRDNVLAAIKGQQWGAFAPNLRGNAWMGPAAAEDLHALLGVIRTQFHADRIVLVGGSMGGSSVLAYAAIYPKDADAVIALCPATDIGAFHTWCRSHAADGPPVLQELAGAIEQSYAGAPAAKPDVYAAHSALAHAKEAFTMPMFVSHGSADPLIPVEQARALAELMNGRQTFQYHELPGGGHDKPIFDMEAAMAFILPQLATPK